MPGDPPESPDEDVLLLTPGPLSTSRITRQAMLRDWGSRDPEFMALCQRVRQRLTALAGAESSHTCIPLQGSGTFAMEATVATLVPRDGTVLALCNGAYGRRMVQICELLGRSVRIHETPEDVPPDASDVERILAADPSITHVSVVHCETTSGIVNPVEAIAVVAQRQGRGLLVDAMSAFGALPLDATRTPFEAVMASANKCLEGVPGVAFVVAGRQALERAKGRAGSLVLDLHDQWRFMEATGQFRFTPPIHVMAALDQALEEHAREGGCEGRRARYQRNCRLLVEGMRKLGFATLLPDPLQAPIIVTFHVPGDPAWDFEAFYQGLRRRGFAIYPGKVSQVESFRIGCIGHVTPSDMERALAAVQEVVTEMGLRRCEPAGIAAPPTP